MRVRRLFAVLCLASMMILISPHTMTTGAEGKTIVLQIETAGDSGFQNLRSSFVVGEDVWVRIRVSDILALSPYGLELLEVRVYYPVGLPASASRSPGEIVEAGQSFNSSHVSGEAVAVPGLHGPSFNLYNDYPAGMAKPVVKDGILALFRIPGRADTVVGSYTIDFSRVGGQMSLVTYNGAGATPGVTNLTPTTSYMQLQGAVVEVVSSLTPEQPSLPQPPVPPAPEPEDETPVSDPDPQEAITPPVTTLPTGQLVTLIGSRGYTFGNVWTDMAPSYYKGRDTMMPVRMLQAFGMEFDWDQSQAQATLRYDGITVVLQIGSTTAYVEGQSVPIVGASGEHMAPELAPGRTMIPLRFVSETLGFTVHWDPSNVVTISKS